MVKVGIVKKDLESALKPIKPIREERVEVISLYLTDGEKECVWSVLDFMDFNLKVVNGIKKAVSEKTGIDIKNVHVLTTHNHGALTLNNENTLEVARISAESALEAKRNSKESKMRYAFTSLKEQVSIIRRKFIPEINSSTTIYYGATKEDDFNSAPFVEKAVEKIKEGKLSFFGKMETNRPFSPFDSGDREVFVCQFIDLENKPIGTIARFSAHAVCCNSPEYYSSDYPYHVRKNFENSFGGTSIFFNGPCADIAPAIANKTSGFEKVLGDLIFESAIEKIANKEFKEIKEFNDTNIEIKLKVRKEIIENKVEINGDLPDDLLERRKYLERISYAETLGFLREKYQEGEKELGDKTTVSVGVLKIDDLTLVGFPGETFSTTAKEVKEAFLNKDICTVTEHGRTVMYLPPKLECERGGYESVCRVTKEGEEQTLKEETIENLKKLI